MALIIEQDFNDYSPVGNPVEVVIKDPATSGAVDFRYIFDVYVTGITLPIRFKVNKDPVLSYGVLNLSRTLQAFVDNTIYEGSLFNNGNGLMGNAIRQFKVHYGFEYRLTPSDPIVEYPDELIGDFKYVYNSSLPYNEWIDFDFNDYDINGGGLFLTDQTTKYIDYNQQGWDGLIMSDPNVYDYTEIKTYDSAGALIDTYHANNVLSPAIVSSRYTCVASGTNNLNNITSGLILGSQPIIDSSVRSYTIQAIGGGAVPISNIITYHIEDCDNYGTQRLLFLNKFGIYEGFNFTLVNTESVSIERKTFKNNPNRLGANGMTYRKSDVTNQTYYVKYADKMKLTSNWISEDEGRWLKELMVSPSIYLDNGDGTLTSVKEITQKDYKIKRNKIDKLINLSIDIVMSNDNYTQTF